MPARSTHRDDVPHRLTELKTADDAIRFVTRIGGLTRARVHPEAAKGLLELNTKNRPVRAKWVNELTRIIATDQWQLTPDAIGVTNDGDLLNGQHRLHACLGANMPIDVLLVTGLSPTTRFATDTGVKRTLSDYFTLEGYKYPLNVASAVALHRRYLANVGDVWYAASSSNNRVTYEEAAAHLEVHPLLHTVQGEAHNVYNANPGVKQSVWSVAMVMCAEVDAVAAELFFEHVKSGVDLSAGDPRLALRRYAERLARPMRQRRRYAKTNFEPAEFQLLHVIRAWNLWRAGKPANMIMLRNTSRIEAPE